MASELIPTDKAIPVKRLTALRENLGLNKAEMASALGMTRQWYIYMENGRCLPSPFLMRLLEDRSLGFLTPNDFFPFIENGEYKTPTNKRVVQDASIDYAKAEPYWLKHFWHWRKKCDPKRTYQQMADLLGVRNGQTIQLWEKGIGLPRSHATILKIYRESDGKVSPDALVKNEALDFPILDWVAEMHEHFMSKIDAKGS